MTIWTLIRYAPLLIALWNRASRTALNDLATWGGLLAEAVALIARLSGVEVPPLTDVAAGAAAGAGLAHKAATGRQSNFSFKEEWARKALEPKD